MSNKTTSPDGDDDLNKDAGLGGFITLMIVVAAIWAASWLLIYIFIPESDKRGTFGDMFGAVNALFSGSALAGVIYTIMLQRRELQMTRQELQRSAETQQKSEEALNEQARVLLLTAQLTALNFIPAISFSIGGGNQANFSMSNVGNTAAYDVDIISIGYYNEEDISPKHFAERFINKSCDQVNRILNIENETFGIYDHTVYTVFPQRKRLRDNFEFPILPEGMFILIQYRDIQGNNYHQLYWAFRTMTEGTSKSYHIGALDPKIPTVAPRIDWDFNLNLRTEDETSMPSYFDDFVSHWNTSISAGYISPEIIVVEDRGTWNDI